MNDFDVVTLLNSEGERLIPRSAPTVEQFRGMHQRRRRLTAAAAALVAAAAASVSVAAFISAPDSPRTTEQPLVPAGSSQDLHLTCDSGVTNLQELDPGFTETGGQKTLDDLGTALLSSPLVSMVEPEDFTITQASDVSATLALTGSSGAVVAEVGASSIGASWFAETIITCFSE